MWPNSFEACVSNRRSLLNALGDRGLSLAEFDSRTVRHRANAGLEEELYLLRRYLFTLECCGLLKYPFTICKQESPDFVCVNAEETYGIEITEATPRWDQREMTLAESGGLSMLGAYGGRYADGAVGQLPERDLTADVIRAVRRKAARVRATKGFDAVQRLELLVYANSNSSFLCDKRDALDLVDSKLARWKPALLARTHVSRVSLVLGGYLAIYPPSLVGVMPLQKEI